MTTSMTERLGAAPAGGQVAAWRVLVTGAGGFVCSHLIDGLLSAGAMVIALDHGFDLAWRARFATAGERLTVIEAEAADLPALTILPTLSVDVLIHGAALTADPDAAGLTPEAHLRANLDPLLAATAWAREKRVKRAIFISSAGVYPRLVADASQQHAEHTPLTEADPASPESLYAVAKLTMEGMIRALRTDYRVPFITIRLSNVYGPFEAARPSRPRTSRLGRMIEDALAKGRMRPDPTLPADWTFAPDLGQAVIALLTADLQHDLYNVGCGRAYTDHELAVAVQAQVPEAVIEGADAGTSPVAPLPGAAIRYRPPMSNARFTTSTGFSAWTSLHDGIGQTVVWMRQHLALGKPNYFEVRS
jgi:nucleoside-diphosphate-sugar epimerase